jgi:membrane-associated phospholipid phosphatase
VLKPLVDESYSAYPSCRTTGAFALITIVAVLLAQQSRSMPWSGCRLAIVVASALVGCAVCVAAVGLNDHHFTDTVGGAAVGTGVVVTTSFMVDLPIVRTQMALVCPSLRRFAAQARPDAVRQPTSAPAGVTASVDPYRMTASVPTVSVGLWAIFR